MHVLKLLIDNQVYIANILLLNLNYRCHTKIFHFNTIFEAIKQNRIEEDTSFNLGMDKALLMPMSLGSFS